MICDLSFRKSTKEDEAMLRDLFMEGFGEREDTLTDLDGRYLMAFAGDELLGVIGLNYQKVYDGMEIDYCTVYKKFRGQSVMTRLFEENLRGFRGRVYCCAWRIRDNERSNLQGILERYGFVKVIDQMCAYQNGFNCHVKDLEGCSFYVPGGACRCYEDLWILEKRE